MFNPELNTRDGHEDALDESTLSNFEDNILLEQLRRLQQTESEKFEETNETIKGFMKELSDKFSSKDKSKIEDALMLMYRVHISQEDRPGGKPYVSHTLGVANHNCPLSSKS